LIKSRPAGTLAWMSIEEEEAMNAQLNAIAAHERIRELRRAAEHERLVRSVRPAGRRPGQAQ
jgi:hypothetical protein